MSFFRRDSGRETSAPGRDDYETAFEDPSEGDALILNPASLTPHSSGHPAQRNEAERRNTTEFEESASERTERVPGGYDFEQQITDGAPALSSNREESTRPSPSHPISTSALGLAASSYRRALSLRERVIPAALYARLGFAPVASSTEGTGLLFSQDADDDDEDDSRSSAYPPRSGNSHLPLPVRPPAFAPPRSTNNGGRVFGGGQGNDGVFANLSAKPDRTTGNGAEYVGGEDGNGDDEILPSYEIAAHDAAPRYWETTVLTPQGVLGPDDICVDGLPVGNLFGFAWNLLVSMSFQFVGFLLTYLLHTTHAAKNGSRAGLGITLIQLGLYLKQRIDHPEQYDDPMMIGPGDATGLDGAVGPNPSTELQTWSWWGGSSPPSTATMATSTMSAIGALPTQLHGVLSSALDVSDPDAIVNGTKGMPSLGHIGGESMGRLRMSGAANEYMAFILVTVGAFLLIGGCLNYWRAVRWARAIQAGMGRGADEEQRVVE